MKSPPPAWTCRHHGPLTPDQFLVCRHGDGIRIKCRICAKAAFEALAARKRSPGVAAADQRRWRQAHPEESRRRQAEKYARSRSQYLGSYKTVREARRARVLRHYGWDPPSCATCGEDEERLLVIDHLDGGGNAHRIEIRRKSDGFCRWLIQQGMPSGYRVLCHNCNHASSSYGRTPPRSYGPFSAPDPSGLDPQGRYRQGQRVACLLHYGNGDPRCACCGLSNYEYLVIDHADGGGNRHRRENGIHGNTIYSWLIRNGLPSGFRVLCFNCNFALGAQGSCHHEGGDFGPFSESTHGQKRGAAQGPPARSGEDLR